MTQYQPNRPATANTPRNTQVEEQCELIKQTIEAQEKGIHELRERLNGVLMQQKPLENSEPMPPKAVLVPLAERLDSIKHAIDHNASIVKDMLQRLEL